MLFHFYFATSSTFRHLDIYYFYSSID